MKPCTTGDLIRAQRLEAGFTREPREPGQDRLIQGLRLGRLFNSSHAGTKHFGESFLALLTNGEKQNEKPPGN